MLKKIDGDTVKWGILGVGDVCEVKSAPAMQKIPGSQVVAVMRRDAAKAADYALRHGIAKWYSDADALINDTEVNAVYIATPPNAHEILTQKVAKAGKPVYVEKPMARTTAECQAMIDTCQTNNVPLYIAYYRRRLPIFEKLRSLLNAGAIGEIRLVKIELFKTMEPDTVAKNSGKTNWRTDPEVAGGGYFYDLAAHQLDYLDYILGPIAQVSGHAANRAGAYATEDTVAASFIFENGVLGVGTWCFAVDPASQKDEMAFLGSHGQIRVAFI